MLRTLGEPQQVGEIGEVARAPAAIEIGAVGSAGDDAEVHMRRTDGESPLGIAGMEGEPLGRQGHMLQHQVAVEAHATALPVDAGAGCGEAGERLLAQNLQAQLLEDLHGGVVDALQRLFVQDLHRPIGVDEAEPRELLDAARRPSTAVDAPVPCHGGFPGLAPQDSLARLVPWSEPLQRLSAARPVPPPGFAPRWPARDPRSLAGRTAAVDDLLVAEIEPPEEERG